MQQKKQTAISDNEIIALYLQRDERAISETDKKYRSCLLGIAMNILHNHADCEECLNDTYLNVWSTIPPTRPLSFFAYIKTVMRRVAIDRYKAEHRQKRIPSELTISLSDLKETVLDEHLMQKELEAQELKRMMDAFVRGLQDRQLYIFMSRYFMGRSIREIAKQLKCSVSTVNKELAQIKKELKEKLTKEGYLC